VKRSSLLLLGWLSCSLALPLPAVATFETGQLIQVVYKSDDAEVGTDLLELSAANLAQQNTAVTAAGTLDLGAFATTNDWADLRVGYFGYDGTYAYFATQAATAPAVGNRSWSAFIGAADVVQAHYRALGSGATVAGQALDAASYWTKMDSLAVPGQYAGLNADHAVGEATLAGLDAAGYVDMYLYVFARSGGDVTLVPGPSAPYTAILRVRENGSTLLNPPGSVNQPPVAVNDVTTTALNTAKIIHVTSNDTDADGTVDGSTVTIVSGPGHGDAVSNGDGTVTYTPDTGYAGPDGFTYTVEDDDGAVSNTATVTVTVSQGNQPPVAVNDAAGTAQETAKIIDVTANDTDADGTVDETTVTIVDGPDHGDAVSNGDGTVTYTPDAWYTGTDSFTYTVEDDDGALSNAATVTVVISGGDNEPPVAVDDQATAFLGTAVIINVTANDTDADGTVNGSTVTIVDGPDHGVAVSNGDGTVTYTPEPGFGGDTDRFRYTVQDDQGATSNEAEVVVQVEPPFPTAPSVNTPPDGGEVDSRTPVLSVNNAVSPQGLPLTYDFEVYTDAQLTALAAAGTAVEEGENATAWQVDALLPDNTQHFWRCRASDGAVYSSWTPTASFFVNVENDPPDAPTISAPPAGSEVATLSPSLEVNNAADPDRDPLVYAFEVYADEEMTLLARSAEGVIEGGGGATAWSVQPSLEDDLTWFWWRARARDDEGAYGAWSPLSSFYTNTAGIHPPTQPEVASPGDGAVVRTLFPILSVVNAQDPDPDTIVYLFEIDRVDTFDGPDLQQSGEVAEGPVSTGWQVEQLTDNTRYYWRARAWDGSSASPWTTGDLGEGPPSFFVDLYNEPPVARDDEATTDRDTPVTIDVIANDTDPDGDDTLDPASVVIRDRPAHGTVQVQGDGTVVYRPNETFGASDTFTYTVKDVEGAVSNEATVFVGNSYKAPTVNNPVSGGIVATLRPTLSVNNIRYEGDDLLRYEFELYEGRERTEPVSTAAVTEGETITSWALAVDLSDNTTYSWRARVTDGQIYSAWMHTAVFTVNTAGADTTVEIEASALISAAAVDMEVVEVTDAESLIQGAAVEIPSGALTEDLEVTIGRVTNPPALPENTLAVGQVIDFGPSGAVFARSVNLLLPYTQDDLDAAGLSDAAAFTVFTFNPESLAWEGAGTPRTDADASAVVIAAEHFSMYTLGVPVAAPPAIPVVLPEEDCSGCCFIATAGRAGRYAPGDGRPGWRTRLLSALLILVLSAAVWFRGRTGLRKN